MNLFERAMQTCFGGVSVGEFFGAVYVEVVFDVREETGSGGCSCVGFCLAIE